MDILAQSTGGLQDHNFLIFDGKQHPKIFGSMDVKITPDFCSFKSKHPGSLQLIFSTFFFSILQKRPGIFKEFFKFGVFISVC